MSEIEVRTVDEVSYQRLIKQLAGQEKELACFRATRTFWPLHLREAIAAGDVAAVRAETERAEGVHQQWLRGNNDVRELMVRAVNKATGLRDNFRCHESYALVDALLAEKPQEKKK